MVNPLIDEIFYLLLEQPTWKVHTLASALSESGKIEPLDADPQKDLFKRNFLVMNGLYQLQTQLAPEQQLQIASLHIELVSKQTGNALESHDPLRDYYLDWQNFDTSSEEIDALLTDFWQRFSSFSPKKSLTHYLSSSYYIYNRRGSYLVIFRKNSYKGVGDNWR
ncbi:DNA-J related domain-containing protein [Pseudoalteromonas sp. Hal040]|uniref:DNA-J related domain-containing protein n=1 Tax=unclassified Pseudoalteromonas TaxID=194690 RepID=UPI00301C0EB8